jgi:uroporphyrinogen-III decarboxylase
MDAAGSKQSIRDRVLAVLAGSKPERLPFIGRLELWRRGLLHTGRLPEELAALSLGQLHREVGMGQQQFTLPLSLRLRGVEMSCEFEGQTLAREADPLVDNFPDVDHLLPRGRTGVMTTRFRSAVGGLTVQHTVLEEMLAAGARSYVTRHPIAEEADFRTLEYILERADWVPRYDRIRALEAKLGDAGLAVPSLGRIPYQQILVDYMRSDDLFVALYQQPQAVERLTSLLDASTTEAIHQLADLDVPYVEFVDNLDGVVTHPRLFREHCLEHYQRYTDLLHAQGKKVGSHTDGNLRPLLGLLAESGLDVCESFSPAPLTPCPFAEAWRAWAKGPLIWGGIPSPLLEARTPEAEFQRYMRCLLEIVGDRPIVLCVVDMVLPNNSIERIRAIADLVERHPL